LPDGEFLGEEGGYAAEDWWAMAVASTGLLVCEREREGERVCVELACRGKRTKRIPLPTPVSS
jgi:hypothetical protein